MQETNYPQSHLCNNTEVNNRWEGREKMRYFTLAPSYSAQIGRFEYLINTVFRRQLRESHLDNLVIFQRLSPSKVEIYFYNSAPISVELMW